MYHHDISMERSDGDEAALRDELVAAGARHVPGYPGTRLDWCTPEAPAPIERMAAKYPDVHLTFTRFQRLGDCVQEVEIVCGLVRRDRRAKIFTDQEGETSCRWGLCCEEDGDRLDPALLRAAATDVLAVEPDAGPGLLSSAVFDLLLLSEALGRFAAAVHDPFADAAPDPRALQSLRELAAVALTIGACGPTTHLCGNDTARVWRMNEALVHAGAEELWATPGQASWPEWVENVVAHAAWALEHCWDCRMIMSDVHDGFDPVAAEREDRRRWAQRELGAGNLLSTCLQTLALFA